MIEPWHAFGLGSSIQPRYIALILLILLRIYLFVDARPIIASMQCKDEIYYIDLILQGSNCGMAHKEINKMNKCA